MVKLFLTRMRGDDWGSQTQLLKPGMFLRFPGGRVWVVASVNPSRAHVLPLTPQERSIIVPSKKDFRIKVNKEINAYGEPSDISPNSALPQVSIDELSDTEVRRLGFYLESGKYDIPLPEE